MGTIVMTGGTSGLGQVAAERLASHSRLLLGARPGRTSAGPAGAEILDLDLARLESVRSFTAAVADRLDGGGIDGLILNAGLSLPHDRDRTADGFETTFAVNHLGHYLLLRLLLPQLAGGATVILTTSSTHDPAQRTMLPPPRHADATLLAHPDRDPERDHRPRAAGGRAYSASKLCNVLTARALAAQPEAAARGLTVLAYDPGPTPGTGLVRGHGAAVRWLWRLAGMVLQPALPRLGSPGAAGRALADLAMSRTRPPAGRSYGALRGRELVWRDPSELARQADVMWTLWRDSARLTGLPEVSHSGHPRS